MLNLKPTHKPVREYYKALEQYERLGVSHEGAVKPAFGQLLESCARQLNWTLSQEYLIQRIGRRPARVDGALVDSYSLARGFWEAKDRHDNLIQEVKKKFQDGYPKDNIIFQAPERIILWQDGKQVDDANISKPEILVEILQRFFNYRRPQYEQWEKASEDFKQRVPELGAGLQKLIAEQRKTNLRFIQAFAEFTELCKQSINPNLSESVVEEMLIQHLLTERIFRTIFNNPDFTRRNVIAVEIEKVIDALTSKSFSRQAFLQDLDYFYRAIEETAATLSNFSQKQRFLNTIYEKFFQGFSVKVANTHGIVYTPQPIVNFMVKSVEDILQKEFGKSLSDKGIHIIDPFVGTGNFIVRVMQEIRKTTLPYKYENELHCNEVMLLPYYISSMNIEHEYWDLTESYKPFEGICLVDTFELAEEQQLSLFTAENTARVEKQRQSPIFVIIGNPPYNVGQLSENDNNKNRKYKIMDKRVSDTYVKDSKATNKNALFDAYVKAIRWASDRIKKEGIIALVTNNSFLEKIAFDGMRKHLNQDFNRIYTLNLQGDIRKDSMRDGVPLGEQHTVFGLSAMVGVAVTFFLKSSSLGEHKIFYSEVDFRSTRKEKFDILEQASSINGIDWIEIKPDQKNTWLTDKLFNDFDDFLCLGNKEAKKSKTLDNGTVFKQFSNGIKTNRDKWVYNFNKSSLQENIKSTIENYNDNLFKWKRRLDGRIKLDSFVTNDGSKISWSEGLKNCLVRGIAIDYNEASIRTSIYRPFTHSFLYWDAALNERRYQFNSIFPTSTAEKDNQVICLAGIGNRKGFGCLATNLIASLDLAFEKAQCFPFYIYDEDDTNRRENITDWALNQFRTQYQDDALTKWDIFHYVYAVLHHQHYRDRYAANLKRELPRIPFAPGFWAFANAGKRLAEIHINYEQQPEYPLQWIENPNMALDWRVEKMKLSKDKTQLLYNDFLTLSNIPLQTFDYRIGNRSALDWIIDQYQIKTDKRSGITNNPNRLDDEQYIVRLIGQVITVSLETVEIVNSLPDLGIPDS